MGHITCSEPDVHGNETCCNRRTGCCTPIVWGIIGLIFGIGLLIAAVRLPMAIDHLVDEGLCDKICIPHEISNNPNSDYEKWRTNDNEDTNPVETYSFMMYNISNPIEMIRYGDKPIVSTVGPFVYRLRKEKYNVTFNADASQVSYEISTMFTFMPELSAPNVTEDMQIISVNLPYTAAMLLPWEVAHDPAPGPVILSCWTDTGIWTHGDPDQQSCIFQNRTVKASLFGHMSRIITIANIFFFRNATSWGPAYRLNPYFMNFFNCSSIDDCYKKTHLQANFGFGGKYELRPGLSDAQGVYPINPGLETALPWTQWTGRNGDVSKAHEYITYLGNTTLTSLWPGEVHVKGTDKTQFSPWMEEPGNGEVKKITVWDEDIMRYVDMTYAGKASLKGIDMFRFVDYDLFNNTDPRYHRPAQRNESGILQLEDDAWVRYGAPSPVYLTKPYMHYADQKLRDDIICTNCKPYESLDFYDTASYLDVEPTTGKTLRGYKRGQFNIQLGNHVYMGQPTANYTWPPAPGDTLCWRNLPEIIVPLFILEYHAEMTQHQADLVQDGLNQIHLAQKAKPIIFGVGIALGIVLELLGIYLAYRWYTIRATYMQSVNEEAEGNVAVYYPVSAGVPQQVVYSQPQQGYHQ